MAFTVHTKRPFEVRNASFFCRGLWWAYFIALNPLGKLSGEMFVSCLTHVLFMAECNWCIFDTWLELVRKLLPLAFTCSKFHAGSFMKGEKPNHLYSVFRVCNMSMVECTVVGV